MLHVSNNRQMVLYQPATTLRHNQKLTSKKDWELLAIHRTQELSAASVDPSVESPNYPSPLRVAFLLLAGSYPLCLIASFLFLFLSLVFLFSGCTDRLGLAWPFPSFPRLLLTSRHSPATLLLLCAWMLHWNVLKAKAFGVFSSLFVISASFLLQGDNQCLYLCKTASFRHGIIMRRWYMERRQEEKDGRNQNFWARDTWNQCAPYTEKLGRLTIKEKYVTFWHSSKLTACYARNQLYWANNLYAARCPPPWR